MSNIETIDREIQAILDSIGEADIAANLQPVAEDI